MFQTVLVVSIQAFPISRMFQTCACGTNKFCVSRVYHACACSNTKSRCWWWTHKPLCRHVSFPSQECFGHALVVKQKLFSLVFVVLVGTCGEHTSFLWKEFQACALGECASFLISGVSIKMALVLNTQTFRSRRLQCFSLRL